MSSALTNGILVTVVSQYIPERSSLSSRQFAFAYTVRIQNEGTEPARLRSRRLVSVPVVLLVHRDVKLKSAAELLARKKISEPLVSSQ